MIAHARLLEVLHYDPETGVFTWKVTLSPKGPAGTSAGSTNKVNGYDYIGVDKRVYLKHRLAWFYVHGVWPDDEIDHRRGDQSNNAITNLRESDRSGNVTNTRLRKDSSTGYKGVRKAPKGMFKAYIKNRYLGTFARAEDAAEAYREAAIQEYGAFAYDSR